MRHDPTPPVNVSRGAPFGRPERSAPGAHRFYLVRVPLDRGGYDRDGAYWGTPSNLYAYEAAGDIDCHGYVRANSRDLAKAAVRARCPGATFFR